MEIRIGNSLKLGGNSKYYLSAPLSGLDTPSIRNGDGIYAGRDGGYVSTQLYGTRTIVIQGFYVARTCDERDSLRTGLLNKLRIRYLYPIFIEGFDENTYFTEGYVTDVKSDIEGPQSGKYQITFLCPDPLIYAGGDGINPESTWISKNISVGNNTVTNPGAFDYAPVFNFTGVDSDLTITNNTTGKSFSVAIEPESGSAGLVIIDMKKRLVTLDGFSINSSRTIDSSWWSLTQGGNELTVECESNITGEIKFKKGYLGI